MTTLDDLKAENAKWDTWAAEALEALRQVPNRIAADVIFGPFGRVLQSSREFPAIEACPESHPHERSIAR